MAIAHSGHAAGRFRVYPDHQLNFYVQYSLAGLREVAIEVLGANLPNFELPAFENIQVASLQITGGVRIGLTLMESELARNFSVMCYDLAERSKAARSPEAAAGILLRTLDSWAELFRRRGHEGLTREEVLGLVGELLTIEALLNDSSLDPEALILGWGGPNGDARDIGVNGARVEIKAQRSTGALKLRISSLAQLDDRGDRVFVLLWRLSHSETGRSLMDVVRAIQARLELRPLASAEFERKITLSSMSADSDFSNEPYSVDDRIAYAVATVFPKLVPCNVPAGITAAQYDIAGPELETHRTTWDSLLGAING